MAPGDFAFEEPTDLIDTIKAVARLTGKNVVLDRNVKRGMIQISADPTRTLDQAYAAYVAELDKLELKTVDEGRVLRIEKK